MSVNIKDSFEIGSDMASSPDLKGFGLGLPGKPVALRPGSNNSFSGPE